MVAGSDYVYDQANRRTAKVVNLLGKTVLCPRFLKNRRDRVGR